MYLDTIQFNKQDLPQDFPLPLSGVNYMATAEYNKINDRLYLSIADENGEPLVTNEKLVAGETLFADIRDMALPSEDLKLLDETGQTLEVNLATINEDIFITIDTTFPGETNSDNTSNGYFNPDGDDANMDFTLDEDDNTGIDDEDSDIDDSSDDDLLRGVN